MLTFVLLILFTAACKRPEGDDTGGTASHDDNHELQALFDQDQGDRSGDFDDIDWPTVSRRDSLRREKVRAMLDGDRVRTSTDYLNAAMIFQHGNDTTEARMAYELARQAVTLDSTNAGARWLMAAAWDRYQQRLGKPQWYGTQFVRDAGEPWRLWDIDTTRVTDAERAALGVPSLEEARARVVQMNQR